MPNGGPAGWRAMFPIEKHELSAGCRKGWADTTAYTTGQASGLYNMVGCRNGRPVGYRKRQASGL